MNSSDGTSSINGNYQPDIPVTEPIVGFSAFLFAKQADEKLSKKDNM
jgi:hypothetical protein